MKVHGEKLEEINLGTDLQKPRPISISSSFQKKKRQN